MAIFLGVSNVTGVRAQLARVLIGLSMVVEVSIAEIIELPSIGSAGNAPIATRQEYQLGQAWLRSFRKQSPIATDPGVYHYTEQLLAKLANRGSLYRQQLSLVVVDNPNFNAFAVPGGVIGVHTGLFAVAQTQHQFASVLSHELAHLSQRHYARAVQQRRGQMIPAMTALLAGLVLAAGNGEAGMAALSATQAAALEAQLRFSRTMEQEADRMSMEILTHAGMNPHAVVAMLENMLQGSRYSQRPPEFLLTHPVTESRIADARNRLLQYPPSQYVHSIDYQLVRTQVIFQQEKTPLQAIQRFQGELSGFSISPEGSRYGLVLAFTADRQYAAATEYLAPLLAKYPHHPLLLIAQSRIDAASHQLQRAVDIITAALRRSPGHYPLMAHYSELLIADGKVQQAAQLLQTLSKQRYFDPHVWYLLAEAQGLAGNIIGLHQARAEYFMLIGEFARANRQLSRALTLIPANSPQATQVNARLLAMNKIKEREKW